MTKTPCYRTHWPQVKSGVISSELQSQFLCLYMEQG